MGCQCAALCGGITHILVTGHENALAKDPKASFKACGKTCASYQISGNNCSNDGSCSVTAAGVDILVDVDDVEEDSVSLEVIAENGDVLFKGQQKFVVTEDEVCGDTCYDSLATFAIP